MVSYPDENFIFGCLITGFLLGSCNSRPSVVGTGRFAEEREIDNMGTVIRRDTNVSGALMYIADGHMSVQLVWNERRDSILTDSIMNDDGISSSIGGNEYLDTRTERQVRRHLRCVLWEI
jgi:hypothetical protein